MQTRKPISITTVALDGQSRDDLRRFTGSLPSVEFAGDVPNYLGEFGSNNLLEKLTSEPADVCIIDLDHDRERAFITAAKLQEKMGSVALFALSSDSDPGLIIRAMRSGYGEYLLKPLNRDQLWEALTRFEERKRERNRNGSGKVLTVLGAKGGAGVTTLATHLGTVLASVEGRRTLLIDLHPAMGDACLYLGVSGRQYHFFELVNNFHRLDDELLNGFVLKHSSGLAVLAAPDSPTAVSYDSLAAVEETLEFLRGQYDVLVVDCPPGLAGSNLAAVEKADELYLVATPEVPAVRNLANYLSHLSLFKCSEERVRIILNRHSKRASVTEQQIEKAVRKPIFLSVPNSYAEVVLAINTGNPVDAHSKNAFAHAIRQWAAAVVEKSSPPERKQEPRGKLSILRLS